MKQILLSLFCVFTLHASAQIVSGIDLTQDLSIQYIHIKASPRLSKWNVSVDCGKQSDDAKNLPNVMDENRKVVEFKTGISALNYFYNIGWALVQQSVVSGEAGYSEVYLLERAKK